MKAMLLACTGLAALALPLAGCNPPDPQTMQQVDAVWTTMCTWLPALGPVIGNANAQIQADYASAQTICASGLPTSPTVAEIDILTVYIALEPYFVHSKSIPKSAEARVRETSRELRARGLM